MNRILQLLSSRRLFSILLLGFSSGLPLALTGSTLTAWMATEKVDLTLIGIFSLVGLPYTLKFLWSPLMDRFVPPFFGRRRGWMLMTQLVLVIFIALMGFVDPAKNAVVMAAFAFLVAFFSASQDIVVDAFRTEALAEEELGLGSSYYILGYRVAMLVSGALALILADYFEKKYGVSTAWKYVYFIMAATMFVGVIASFWAPEPDTKEKPPQSLKDAVVKPFVEFFSRKGALEILTFIIIYKLDVVVATAMMTPFFLELGFTKTDIGVVIKGFGFVATIVGGLLGGIVMTKLDIRKSLWAFGIIQGISGLSFIALAHVGKSYPLMVSVIALENLSSAMGTTAYSAFLMSLCNRSFTATQYALLTSLMALTRVIAGTPTGWMAKNLGWETYYIVSMLLMIPGLLMLTRYKKWQVHT